jgi:hypothetical protein
MKKNMIGKNAVVKCGSRLRSYYKGHMDAYRDWHNDNINNSNNEIT